MPAANDAWVRSVGLSKIIATVCGPASGWRVVRRPLEVGGQREDLRLLGRGEVVVAQEVPHDADLLSGSPGHASAKAATSSSVSTSGGANRSVAGPVLLSRKPARLGRVDDGGRVVGVEVGADQQAAAPTAVTAGSAATASASRLPTFSTSSSSPSSSMVPSTASAAAQATGLPPKVVPWLPGSKNAPAAPVAMVAPIGMPPPRPLARVTMSGGSRQLALGVVGEPATGAADAGLHLVDPQQRAVLGGDPPGGGEVALGRDDHAGLALDRLEHDGRGVVGRPRRRAPRRRRTAPR